MLSELLKTISEYSEFSEFSEVISCICNLFRTLRRRR